VSRSPCWCADEQRYADEQRHGPRATPRSCHRERAHRRRRRLCCATAVSDGAGEPHRSVSPARRDGPGRIRAWQSDWCARASAPRVRDGHLSHARCDGAPRHHGRGRHDSPGRRAVDDGGRGRGAQRVADRRLPAHRWTHARISAVGQLAGARQDDRAALPGFRLCRFASRRAAQRRRGARGRRHGDGHDWLGADDEPDDLRPCRHACRRRGDVAARRRTHRSRARV